MPVTYQLYFAEEESARKIASTLKGDNFACEVREPGGGIEDWSLQATRDDASEELDQTEERLDELAESLGGEYDGYSR
jgi:hypothetical protein